MNIRIAPASLPLLLLAAAVRAAPPLSIPVPRPTPEQEALMLAEAEEELTRDEIEEARFHAEAAAETESGTESPTETPAPPVEVPPAPPVAPLSLPARPTVISPAPPAANPDSVALRDAPPRPPAPDIRLSETNAVFRRDPFWSVSVARQRKADHDARVAAALEEAARIAAIEKARQEAIARGEDVEALDDDALAELAAGDARPDGPKSSETFDGATEEQWDAALAKIPPRSGYFGGKKPALVLKGNKTPYFVGDELCATNRGIVFTWRLSSVDFRSYTHELERVSARPVQ